MVPHLFCVRGRLPLFPAVGKALVGDEHWANGDWVALRATMRVVAAVRPKRVFDRQPADGAEIRLRVLRVIVTGFALVPGVKPARSAAIRSTVRHATPQ